jgi:hypothetical protein
VLTSVGDEEEEAGFQPAAGGQRRHPAARAPAAGPLRGRQATRAACRAGTWVRVHGERRGAGHAHRRAESSGRALPWRLTEQREEKRNRD